MAKKTSNLKNDRLIIKFIATYIILMGLFLLLIGLEPVKKIIDINGIYSKMIVYLTALILEPFDVVKGISGSVIRLKGLALDVRFGCNGLEAFLIYGCCPLLSLRYKEKDCRNHSRPYPAPVLQRPEDSRPRPQRDIPEGLFSLYPYLRGPGHDDCRGPGLQPFINKYDPRHKRGVHAVVPCPS